MLLICFVLHFDLSLPVLFCVDVVVLFLFVFCLMVILPLLHIQLISIVLHVIANDNRTTTHQRSDTEIYSSDVCAPDDVTTETDLVPLKRTRDLRKDREC